MLPHCLERRQRWLGRECVRRTGPLCLSLPPPILVPRRNRRTAITCHALTPAPFLVLFLASLQPFLSPSSSSLLLRPLRLSLPRSSAAALSAHRPSCPNHRCFSSTANGEAKPAENGKEGAPAEANEELKKLREENAKLTEEKKELHDKWMRALAEAQNTLARTQTQLGDAKKYAVQGFAKQLLEVADVCEIAVKHAEESAEKKDAETRFNELFEGLSLMQKALLKVFERNGLQKFEPLGEKFDPFFEEAIFTMEDDTKEPNTVGVVLKSGYKLHDRCLRAAQVGTIKASAKPKAE